MGFVSLPVELLNDIVQFLVYSEDPTHGKLEPFKLTKSQVYCLTTFRSVCRSTNATAAPMLFRDVVIQMPIKFDFLKSGSKYAYLHALADGKTATALYARTLHVQLTSTRADDNFDATFPYLFARALKAFQNVDSA